jgi:hypothetical protein
MAQQTWTQVELDRNGGHTPECEQYCDPSCPIGQERTREANRRAALAQKRWNNECEIGPVGGWSTRSWCAVHQTYADRARTGVCNSVFDTHQYRRSLATHQPLDLCGVCGLTRREHQS